VSVRYIEIADDVDLKNAPLLNGFKPFSMIVVVLWYERDFRVFCFCRVFMLKLGVFDKHSQETSIIILRGHAEIHPNPMI